jgi:hypothetical protein
MSLAYDATRHGRTVRSEPVESPAPGRPRFGRAPAPNTISASQARAARRREARRDEQAVSAWLRELAGRPR